MKRPNDRLPEQGNGYPQNGYGYPQNGYPQNGYGYSQEGQNNGYQQEGYPNGYGYGGYPGYGYGGYGYGGYGYGGYPGYGYGGYPGYGYGGYPGYGYGGYGYGYPQQNYIADSYPQEDYGDPYATEAQQQAQNNNTMANTPKTQTQSATPADNTQQSAAQQTATPAPQPAPEQQQAQATPAPQAAQATPTPQPEQQAQATPTPAAQPAQQTTPPGESDASQFVDVDLSKFQGDEALKAEAEDLKRKWYTVTAEYENYRKRTQNTRLEAYKEGRADIIKKLLPIGDNLDRAIKSCQDETTKKGVEMVLNAFDKLLESEDITVINPLGQPFDPNECEAIMAMDPQEGQESGIVIEVYVKGYKQGDKVLRFAQVIVTK